MNSFLRVWEESIGSGPAVETKSTRAIRAGLNVRDDFWNDFMNVCNNAEALAALLDVRIDQVTSWGHKVRHALKLVEESDRRDGPPNTRKKTLSTGKFDFDD